MAHLSAPKGTRDFYPEEIAMREHIFASWHATCRRYGFEMVDAPMFEHLEVYTQKSGDEIEKQLYVFKDKGGRTLALRPELTPSIARMVAARGQSLKYPLRWYSIPRLFRYERMQRGRLREFYQLNMDILGIQNTTADAELIAAVVDMMRDLGFTADDFSVLVSSRNLLEELFIASGIKKEQMAAVYALLDKHHKIPQETYRTELAELIPQQPVRKTIETILEAKTLDDIGAIRNDIESFTQLQNLFDLITAYRMNDFVTFDIGIVRGLAYYTGIVFEVFDKRRSMRAVAGGGRYDKLVERYGGASTPAVGFAAGDVVLGELMQEKGIEVPLAPRSSVFIVSFDRNTPQRSIGLAQELRDRGISAEFSLRTSGISKQMKQASAARAAMVVFVGGDEEAKGMVKIKMMATGEEQIVDTGSAAEAIDGLLHQETRR
jgi:histidyl-tRNA synthetase